jgi:hypothetical protein
MSNPRVSSTNRTFITAGDAPESKLHRPNALPADFSDDEESNSISPNTVKASTHDAEHSLSPRSKEKQQRALHYAGITRALHDSPRKGTTNVDAEEIKKVEEHLAHMRKLRKDNEDRLRRQKGSSVQRMQELQAFLSKANEDEDRIIAQIEHLKQEQQARRDNKRREMAEARARNREKLEYVSNTTPRTSVPIYKRKEDEWRERCVAEEMERADILAQKRTEQFEHKFNPNSIQAHRAKHDAIARQHANVQSQRLEAVRSPPKLRVPATKALKQAKEDHARVTRGRELEVEQTRDKVLRGREYAAAVRVPAIDQSKANEVLKRKKGEHELQIERRRQEGLANRLKLLKDRNAASRLVKQGNDEIRHMSPEKFRAPEPEPAPAAPRHYPDYLTAMRRHEEDLMASTDGESRSASPRKRTKQSVSQELCLRIERQEARVERAEHALKTVINARLLDTGRAATGTGLPINGDELDARVRAGALVDELRCELIELKFKLLANEQQAGGHGIDIGLGTPLNSPRAPAKARHTVKGGEETVSSDDTETAATGEDESSVADNVDVVADEERPLSAVAETDDVQPQKEEAEVPEERPHSAVAETDDVQPQKEEETEVPEALVEADANVEPKDVEEMEEITEDLVLDE